MVQPERTVVIGVDGSPEALEAARFAALEAQTRGATLVLAHAIDLVPMAAPFPPEFLQSRREQSQKMLSEFQLQLKPPAGATPHVRLVLEVASPVAMLAKLSHGADLVVVGHRRHGPLDKLLNGTVSGPVAQQAGCPVLVVPRGWTAWSGTGQPVVVALDGESSARSALDLAFTSAQRLQVDLVVLHAAEASSLQWVMDEDRVNLATILAGAELDFPDVVVRTVRVEADPGRAILAAAGAAGLLVVGRPHGDQHVGSWARSVANTVLQQVTCPVAVVPGSRAAAEGASRAAEAEVVV